MRSMTEGALQAPPITRRRAKALRQTLTLPEGLLSTIKVFMVVFGLIVGLAMAWGYQICSLIYLNKPAAKASLK